VAQYDTSGARGYGPYIWSLSVKTGTETNVKTTFTKQTSSTVAVPNSMDYSTPNNEDAAVEFEGQEYRSIFVFDESPFARTVHLSKALFV
jgi:hypothetical protein